MACVFDGCTEILLQEIMASSPDINAEAENLMQQLPKFQNECVSAGLCPKGELIRGLECRNFLRDAVQRMIKKLSTVNEDATISSIVRQTQDFIENVGEETEAERAYIVARNLVIVSESIASQTKKQMLPILTKQPVQMVNYHVGPAGLREFEGIVGFSREKGIEKLLKTKLSPMTVKQSCETRYRHLFFNLLVRLVVIKEMGEERNK